MSTLSTDLLFEPKVWSDHIQAYFDQKLVYGAFALRNSDLEAEGTGLTVNFPFYKSLGAAEEPDEDVDLVVDKLSDDSFNATVFEIGKAVGIKKKAFKATADSKNGLLSEGQRQLARVHAEKVDNKLNTEINLGSSFKVGFLASAAADTMSVARILRAKIVAFGDKHDESEILFMHSLQFLDLMTDTTAGFLKADANDPLVGIKGFEGRILGLAIITVDTVLKVADIDNKDAYRATFHKANSYGIMNKQEMEFDDDKDILAREILITANQWYAVKSFHAKINPLDRKAGSITTTLTVADGI